MYIIQYRRLNKKWNKKKAPCHLVAYIGKPLPAEQKEESLRKAYSLESLFLLQVDIKWNI